MSKAATGEKLAAGLNWAAGSVFILLPFWAFLSTWAGSNFGYIAAWKLLPDVIVFISAPLAIWLGFRSPRGRRFLMESWVVKVYILYILLHIALSVWALKHDEVTRSALIAGLITNLRFIGFFLVCYILASSNSFLIKNWIKLTLWPAAVVVIFGVIQRFILPLNFLSHFGYGADTIQPYQTIDAGSGPVRLQSTLRGANPLGAYLSLIIPAWLAIFWRKRMAMIIGLLAAVVVLGFSYSRSAEAGVIVSGIVLAWWLATSLQRRWFIIVAVFVLGASLFGLYSQRNSQLVQENLFHTSSRSSSPKTSNVVRREALKNGLNDVYQQPFGRGPGTAGPASAHNNQPARIAENYYVQIAQEVGMAGLVLFISINLLVVLQLWRRRFEILPKILLVSLAGITIINMVSHAWADDTLSMLWWGLAGVACSTAILGRRNETTAE